MRKLVIEKPIYNNEYEMQIYRSDIIKVIPNQFYRFVIFLESYKGDSKITPTITLPFKKGIMRINNKKYDYMISTCIREV